MVRETTCRVNPVPFDELLFSNVALGGGEFASLLDFL